MVQSICIFLVLKENVKASSILVLKKGHLKTYTHIGCIYHNITLLPIE